MSKLSTLKQEAYQAGKKRDWVRAVSVYEQILELDKNNPTVINELGDLCLKLGETSRGVKHFLGAAAKYRQSGLLNNAVAIYKKILRYEEDNQNAHWYLAESRANQGLLVEGEHHSLIFLGHRESLTGEIKEIFLKRCVTLFDLYPDSLEVQDNLLQVFRMWNMALEAGRTQIQLGCLRWINGESELAAQLVTEALSNVPELSNYPENARWMELQGKSRHSEPEQNFDSVALDDPFASIPEPIPEPIAEATSEAIEEVIIGDSVDEVTIPETKEFMSDETSFGEVDFSSCNPEPEAFDLSPDDPEEIPVIPQPSVPEMDAPDDSGCFNLDTGSGSSFDDLIAQASAGLPEASKDVEEAPEIIQTQPEESFFGIDDDIPAVADSPKVNLLDELLAEDTDEDWTSSDSELATISKEIGSQLSGNADSDDPESLYEMGMVYLDMGLHDQAAESFQKATCHSEFAVRAYEMWGIALQRANRIDEAIAVLTDGLDVPEEGSREYLGLLYHIARAHQQGENREEAQRLFEMIQNQDPGFLDVGRRLSTMVSQP